MHRNIAQVEFFHVGGRHTTSLDALFDESGERIADGLEFVLQEGEAKSGIKTVVRFYDESGALTRIARKAAELSSKNRALLNDFVKAGSLRRWWLDLQSCRLAGQSIALKEQVKLLAAEQLRKAVIASRDVAVERSDHAFRPMRREEAHELIVAAEKAKGVWLFVFKPNDLLADKNTAVAHVM